MKRIYLLLVACFMGVIASAQMIYQPTGTSSFTGGNTYCVGAPISPLIFDYTTCNSGTGIVTPASCSVYWYYNTTNTNVYTAGVTTLASGPISMSCATTPTGTLTYTPSLSVGGNYYFFCAIVWTGGSAGCPGGVSDTVFSPTQLVRISPPPIAPASPINICVGSNMTLTNAFAGGTWTSSNSGVVSVNSSTGVATGVTVGGAFITYTLGGCFVASFIYANDTPTVIMPTSAVDICVGGTTTLSNTTPGCTWSSSVPSVAAIGTGGLVSAFTAGTTRISYTNSSTGCFTTKLVNVLANPAAIGGSTGICLGGNSLLTDATPGGLWSSSSPGTAFVNSSSGLVSGLLAGAATISYTMPTGCYITTSVSVNPPPGTITGPSQVCSGSSITLANAVGGGAWSSGATGVATVVGSTGVVTGVSTATVPTTVNISYTTPGCTPVSRVVTVNPLPGTISGVLTTCYGQATTLTSSVSGGTWSSSDTAIATVIAVSTISGDVTGVSMGTVNIMYTVGSGCSTSATVTVYPLAPIVGSDSVCVGSQIALTNIVGGGTWVSGNPANATINPTTGIVNGLVAGITYIGYTLPTGCATTFFLNVIPQLPSIGGPVSICSNSEVTMSNAVPGGRWRTSNMYVAAIDSITGKVNGHFPDTAVISYTKFGCITSVIATINPLPTPTVTYVASIHSLSTPAVYTSYQWYDSIATGPTAVLGATTSFFSLPAVYGKFAVMVTDANGCSAMSPWYRHAVGVNDLTPAMFRIFPNPAVSIVTIEAPVPVKAIVSSVDGKILLSEENAEKISIKDFANGMYFISLYDGNGQLLTVQKLIKQ